MRFHTIKRHRLLSIRDVAREILQIVVSQWILTCLFLRILCILTITYNTFSHTGCYQPKRQGQDKERSLLSLKLWCFFSETFPAVWQGFVCVVHLDRASHRAMSQTRSRQIAKSCLACSWDAVFVSFYCSPSSLIMYKHVWDVCSDNFQARLYQGVILLWLSALILSL